MEQVDLTVPISPPDTLNYRVDRIMLDWAGSYIEVVLHDNNGLTQSFHYSGQEAIDLMLILNTANLTNNSLHKRTLNRLIADGKLAGTVSGAP